MRERKLVGYSNRNQTVKNELDRETSTLKTKRVRGKKEKYHIRKRKAKRINFRKTKVRKNRNQKINLKGSKSKKLWRSGRKLRLRRSKKENEEQKRINSAFNPFRNQNKISNNLSLILKRRRFERLRCLRPKNGRKKKKNKSNPSSKNKNGSKKPRKKRPNS